MKNKKIKQDSKNFVHHTSAFKVGLSTQTSLFIYLFVIKATLCFVIAMTCRYCLWVLLIKPPYIYVNIVLSMVENLNGLQVPLI